MRFRPWLLVVLATILLGVTSARGAVVIDYTPTVKPDSASPYRFTFVVFSGTSWNVSSNVLTMTTAFQRGIWFGNNGTGGVNWSIAPNNEGNYLKVDAKLSSGATDWSIYLGDGQRGASFVLNHNSIEYYTYNGTSTVTHTLSRNLTDGFHTFEFLVKGTKVSYAVDGELLVNEGLAMPYGNIMVIGDGSGTTISGTGSMYVAGVDYVGNPNFALVPEPASLATMSLLSVAALVRRPRR